jgi:hypothetical protein
MRQWLILDVDLKFVEGRSVVFPRDYRADVIAEGDDLYYGMHFVSGPAKVDPGDSVSAKIMLRAYPEVPCLSFQLRKRIWIKEGSLTRAEGIISGRTVYERLATIVTDFLKEFSENFQ